MNTYCTGTGLGRELPLANVEEAEEDSWCAIADSKAARIVCLKRR